MAPPLSKPSSHGFRHEQEFADLLADLFRQHGWRIKKEHSVAEKCIDLVVARGGDRYVIEIKAASEGRSERICRGRRSF